MSPLFAHLGSNMHCSDEGLVSGCVDLFLDLFQSTMFGVLCQWHELAGIVRVHLRVLTRDSAVVRTGPTCTADACWSGVLASRERVSIAIETSAGWIFASASRAALRGCAGRLAPLSYIEDASQQLARHRAIDHLISELSSRLAWSTHPCVMGAGNELTTTTTTCPLPARSHVWWQCLITSWSKAVLASLVRLLVACWTSVTPGTSQAGAITFPRSTSQAAGSGQRTPF